MYHLACTMLLSGLLSGWLCGSAWAQSEADRSADGSALDCGLELPHVAENAPTIADKSGSAPADFSRSAVRRQRVDPRTDQKTTEGRFADGRFADGRFGTVGHGEVGGALSGKTVYVSAGHGFVWRDNLNRWGTQRGNTHDLVEDFISAETVSHYLVQYLRNMGAYVVPVRESDLQANIAIVDDGDDGDDGDGGFTTTGSFDLTPGATGYGPPSLPITDQSNPFALGGSLEGVADSADTGRAIWTFDVPEDGAYNVYVAYTQAPDRADDAHYIVRHAGGEAHFRVDQRRHGSTWVLLGRFWFDAGMSPDTGAVLLANDSAAPGSTLSADAARIGGGVGVIDRGGGASGRPMFENAARYTAQMHGAPPSVYDYSSSADGSDDVGTRSRFAGWDQAPGEDAVYVAWHTNAPDPARGTVSYVYGPVPPSGPLTDFTGVPGSIELMQAVHDELVGDIQTIWDPAWNDRGMHTAYFGEVNPNHNPEMPAVLLEVAFHSTAADAEYLRDPQFRRTASRSISQGIARYFADRDGAPLVLPPEPPMAARMQQSGPGSLRVAWRPAPPDPAGGDAATGYRVYLSRDGRAFDDGHDVPPGSTEWLVGEAGVEPGNEPLFARVTAINSGGESLPSPVVGGRRAPDGQAQVLIVAGFTRLDGSMLIDEDLSPYALANIERGFIEHINDTSYVARHGLAVGAAGVSFDAVTADAVALGDVDLSAYKVVDWFLGEESSCCDPLQGSERDALGQYLLGGGYLFMSAAELGWALVARGTPEDAAYFEDTFHALYVADDADTYSFAGAGGPLSDLGALDFADFGPGGYDAEWPDVIDPAPGAITALTYDTGASAATWYEDPGTGARVLLFGFPFETVAGEQARSDIMAAILAGFDVEADVEVAPGPDAGPGVDPPGDPDDASGCGCRSDGRGAPMAPLLIVLGGLLFMWNNGRDTRPHTRSTRSRHVRTR